MAEHVRQQMEAARSAFRKGQFQNALDLYRQLAETGQAECQVFLAWMLGEGIGCDKNEADAARFYERAAALGNPVGSFYFGRWLTKQGDHERALRLYRDSAKANYLPAVFRVGYSLVQGKGVPKNLRQGYALLVEATVRGHVFALRELGVQDWQGGRGFLWRIAAPVEFTAAVLVGLALSTFNKHSDRLRG